jgi:hypothetical protein
MTLIMHGFLERPSSCMLFWNDPSIHDKGHSRKAYMMKVSPEKHT